MFKYLIEVGEDKKEIEFKCKNNKEFVEMLSYGMLLHGFSLDGYDKIFIKEIKEVKE